MNDADESELYRLSAELEQIDRKLPISDMQREALKKAAMVLSMVFARNLRQTLEENYNSLGQPLTEQQRQHLISLGIDPDAD
jgi:hypothetical protein